MKQFKETFIDVIENPWPIYVYFTLTAIETVGQIFALHWKDGFSAIISVSMALIAGSVLKSSFYWRDMFKKIAGVIIAVFLMVGAHRASYDFTISIFNHIVDGVLWCYLGAILGFLFTNKNTA